MTTIFALLSSISLALMVFFDKLLLKDFYQNNVHVMWTVSCAATGLFGGVIALMLFSYFGYTLQSVFAEPIYPILVALAGVLAALTLLVYFSCFADGKAAAVIAGWLAAGPIFIYFGIYGLSLSGVTILDVTISTSSCIAALLASVGLAVLEFNSNQGSRPKSRTLLLLVLMVILNSAYIILFDQVIQHANVHAVFAHPISALLPFFFHGFLCAAAISACLLARKTYTYFKPKFLQSIKLILVLECIGMLVFFFEALGLSFGDPVFVTIIVGAHILFILLIEYICMYIGYRKKLLSHPPKVKLLGGEIDLDTKLFPVPSKKEALLQIFAAGLVCSAIVLF